MNQQSQLRVGNLLTFPKLTAREVWGHASHEDLRRTIESFDLENLLVTLARINLYLHRNTSIFECDRFLKGKFCDWYLRKKIQNRRLDECNVFNRESTLLLLDESVRGANRRPANIQDNIVNPRRRLGNCYLIANGLSHAETTESGSESTEEQRKEFLAGLMPTWEYAIYSSPWHLIRNSLVRTEQYLEALEQVSQTFDVNEIFCKATGLTIQDYQYLIFKILRVALEFSPEEILEGSALLINMNPSPSLAPLYDKLLEHICISIDELGHALEGEAKHSLPNEFRLWRKYPLVKSDDNKVFPIDISFLRDKLDTGVFWIIRDQLEEEMEGKGVEIIRLWGEVFENYAASIIQRGINTQTQPRMETCIPNPKYIQKEEDECTDIAVYGSDTLILLECKAPLLSARTKFSRDSREFYNGLKSKIIAPYGIKQLCNAIEALTGANNEDKREVSEIDISSVKKIYPVLVLSDRTFSFASMNRLFESEFRRLIRCGESTIEPDVMSLAVLTIDELENLEPYLRDTPFHAHLDKWIQGFDNNEPSPFTEYLHSLMKTDLRDNPYIEREFKRIYADVIEYFTARGVDW